MADKENRGRRKYETVDKLVLYVFGGLMTLGVGFISITYQAKLNSWDRIVIAVEQIEKTQAAEMQKWMHYEYRINRNEINVKENKVEIKTMKNEQIKFEKEVRLYWENKKYPR